VRRLEHKLGINGSPTCELVFDNAPAKLIGQRKRGLITYVMSLMNGARVGISAQGTGIGEASYRAARDYAASRRQFGVTIDSFPALRDLLCEMSVELQASRLLAYYSSKCVDLEMGLTKKFDAQKGTPEAQETRKRLKLYAAFNKMLTPMAKYYASEMSMRASNGAVAVLGGSGYMKDYPVERYLRDARITTIYEGTSQLQVVAAIAGVTAGLYNEVIADVLSGVVLTPELSAKAAAITAFQAEVDAAVAYVKDHPAGKTYHDLHARQLVDGALAAVQAALLVRFAAKFAEKTPALDYWLAVKLPAARAELAKASSGYLASVTDFEALAPAVPAEA
jgi:alkylation response protein AidB-like acyl-CoA dehydrogenase